MENLPSMPNSGNSTFLEKVIRYGTLAAAVYLGVLGYNKWIGPNINLFMSNLPYLIGFCIVILVAVFGIIYVASQPAFVWMQYKNLCRYITGFLIKLDPLSFMDSYISVLTQKRKGLQISKTELKSKGIELKRQMDDLVDLINTNLKKANAAKQGGDNDMAANLASEASKDKQSLDLFTPIYDKIVANCNFLDKLDKNWGMSIDSLTREVDRKRREYTTLKIAAKALGSAEEFGRGDTEAAKTYQLSVQALQENVSQKIGYINEFEANSKDIMKSLDLDKKVQDNDGMALLDQYTNNHNIFLPESDWTAQAKVLSSSPVSKSSKESESLISLKY